MGVPSGFRNHCPTTTSFSIVVVVVGKLKTSVSVLPTELQASQKLCVRNQRAVMSFIGRITLVIKRNTLTHREWSDRFSHVSRKCVCEVITQ